MLLGTWGCVINAIAVVLKAFLPGSEPAWPLYTLFMLLGWTIYAPAQLLVLYSRLHLVNQHRILHRWVLAMIIIVATVMIIPTWVLVWPAYNPYNHYLSSIYSPREAIIDRCTQIGYTVVECVVSGIYIFSLTKLLNLKSSVRQRRVMTDLIYVNIIAVCLDILTVVMVFLNQTGISHPIQCFSYILKLKLEFMVLNQLMAVAARGVRKESFAERRYHHPSTGSDKPSLTPESKPSQWELDSSQGRPKPSAKGHPLPGPPPTSKVSSILKSTISTPIHDHTSGHKWQRRGKAEDEHGKQGDHSDNDDDDELRIHLWDKHGKLVMEAPWFAVKGIA